MTSHSRRFCAPIRPRHALLLAAAGMVVATAGGQAAGAAIARESKTPSLSGTINVYAALTTQGGQGFASAFEISHPGVRVHMVTGGTGGLATQLAAQKQSGHVQADVVL